MGEIRVGCKRDARKALRGELAVIGQGAHRTAYVDARHLTVYKVTYRENWDEYDATGHGGPEIEVSDDANNRREAAAYADLTRLHGDEARDMLAPTTPWLIDGIMVVAQPFYRLSAGDVDPDPWSPVRDELFGKVRDAAHKFGIGDMHGDNWRVKDDGTSPVITDFEAVNGW